MAAGLLARRGSTLRALCGFRGFRAAVAAGVCAFALALSFVLTPAASAQLFADEESRARLDEHQRQLRQFAERIVELLRSNDEMGAQLTDLGTKLDATNRQLGRISQRLQNAEDELRQLRGAQEEQSETLRRESTGEADAIKSRLVATEEQLAEVREMITALQQQAATIGLNVAELANLVELPPEQELYDSAFAEFQGRRFQSALDGFRRVQKFYPNGKFQVNVGYWMSNALLELGDYEGVVAAAQDLIIRHPDSDKTPGAMLFMAQALRQLGREDEAQAMFRRIVGEHPTSLAADKARLEL